MGRAELTPFQPSPVLHLKRERRLNLSRRGAERQSGRFTGSPRDTPGAGRAAGPPAFRDADPFPLSARAAPPPVPRADPTLKSRSKKSKATFGRQLSILRPPFSSAREPNLKPSGRCPGWRDPFSRLPGGISAHPRRLPPGDGGQPGPGARLEAAQRLYCYYRYYCH